MDEVNPYAAPAADLGVQVEHSTGTHEFGWREDQTIGRTGRHATTWGVLSLVVGALTAIAAVAGIAVLVATEVSISAMQVGAIVAVLVPIALVHLATGWLYVSAGRAFTSIVETSGADVEHLMTALVRLKDAFRIEVFVTVVSLVLGYAVWIAGAFVGD